MPVGALVIALLLAPQSVDERLFAAIVAGDVAVVRHALSDGASLVARNADFIDLQPLAFAAWEDQLEIVDVLLEAGAHASARDELGRTALMQAKSGPVVTRLLEAGADVKNRDLRRRSALWEMVAHADPDAVKLLLAAGADPNAMDVDREETVLIRAAENRNDGAEIVAILLDAGAELNANGRSGTALSNALSRGSAATTNVLLAAGARLDIPAWRLPLEAAARSATEGFEKVQMLLEAGIVLDVQNRELADELVTDAARTGDADLLRLLIEAGANPNATRRDHGRPAPDEHIPAIVYATYSSDIEALRVLIDADADVDAPTLPRKDRPLRLAAEYGAVEHVELLLAAGATVDARDADGVTALMAAARYQPRISVGEPEREDFTETLALLIDAGSDVNASVEGGGTPLVLAIVSGKIAHVRLLLEAGADPLVVAPTGQSLVELIRDPEADVDPAIVRLLEEALANR